MCEYMLTWELFKEVLSVSDVHAYFLKSFKLFFIHCQC